MNRTGLFIALSVAFVTGVAFAVFPQLDLWLARQFYDAASQQFALGGYGPAQFFRRGAMWIAWAFAAPAIAAPFIKLIWPRKPLLVPGRAVIFLLVTLFLNAIILPNVIFKVHWGRARPTAITEFHGVESFKPWWDPRGTTRGSGSFFSGEAATAFWTYAPAALAPAAVRPWAFAAATLFGLTTGILRMAFGGHYASDIIAAGVSAFVVTWLAYAYLYRWKFSRYSDQQIDQLLTDRIGELHSQKLFWRLAVIVGALTLVRLVALQFSVVDLFPDEARYWAWAQTPAFGYFSKPPLIAWIISVTERFCGDSESCLRASIPLFYAATALVCYFIGRNLYGDRVAFWTGLCIALATGVVFSARIVSTDVPLLFFWSVSLLAYLHLLDRPSWRWAMMLGVALGLGLLAKYAMAYFFVCTVAATFIDSRARALWRRSEIWAALVIALLFLAPNLIWNVSHNFVTFRHTRENLDAGGFAFHPFGALGFLASQFGVIGPFLFVAFLVALFRPGRVGLERKDRILMAFALPPLVLVTVAAFAASAKANWAAPSAIAIVILAVAILVRHDRWRWIYASIALGILFQVGLFVSDAFADRVSLPFLAKPDLYHRTLGWKNMATNVRQSAEQTGAQTIAADHRDVLASLSYYLRDDHRPILSWPTGAAPTNQFDLDRPLTAAAKEPVLYLTNRPLPQRLAQFYRSVETMPPIDAATGPNSTRRVFVFKLSGVLREIGPLDQ